MENEEVKTYKVYKTCGGYHWEYYEPKPEYLKNVKFYYIILEEENNLC